MYVLQDWIPNQHTVVIIFHGTLSTAAQTPYGNNVHNTKEPLHPHNTASRRLRLEIQFKTILLKVI